MGPPDRCDADRTVPHNQYTLTYMMAQKRGRIINISSFHGLVDSEFKSAYVAAKHGSLTP